MANQIISLHGRVLGFDKDGNLYHDGKLLVPSWRNPAQKVRMFDDFMGDLIVDEWEALLGSGTGQTLAISEGIGGLLLFTTDDTAGTMAADGVQLVGRKNFQASNGGLVFEARVRHNTDILTRSMFLGFTDVDTIEAAIVSAGSGDTITTTASDAVGFMFDSRMTTKQWWAVGVAGDTDATHATTGVAPVAAAFDRLRVEIDANGKGLFYVNGVLTNQISGVVTPATDLVPTVSIFSTTTTVHTATLDYILAEMDR